MSNASDSTVEQTKEIIYTVILLDFTKREKNASDDLQVEKNSATLLYSYTNKNNDSTYAKPNMKKNMYAQY